MDRAYIAVLFAIAIAGPLLIKSVQLWLRLGSRSIKSIISDLNVYERTYLFEGRHRTFELAVAVLLHHRVFSISNDRLIKEGDAGPPDFESSLVYPTMLDFDARMLRSIGESVLAKHFQTVLAKKGVYVSKDKVDFGRECSRVLFWMLMGVLAIRLLPIGFLLIPVLVFYGVIARWLCDWGGPSEKPVYTLAGAKLMRWRKRYKVGLLVDPMSKWSKVELYQEVIEVAINGFLSFPDPEIAERLSSHFEILTETVVPEGAAAASEGDVGFSHESSLSHSWSWDSADGGADADGG